MKYFSPGVLFRDPDTCCHLRRILYSATHSMQFPLYDPLVAHPHGAIPMLSPLYDWISAVPSFIFSAGNPSPLFVQRVSIILTLMFGLLALFFIGLLVYRATNSMTTALLSAFLAGMTDQQIKYTSLEIIDHNSFLMLLFAIILVKTYTLFCKNKEAPLFKDIILLSLLLALLFWVWSGAYIYIGVIALIHFSYSVLRKNVLLLDQFAFAYALSGILVAPLAIIHYSLGKGLLRFEHVSLFTVLFMMSTAASFYCVSQVLQWKSSDRKRMLLIRFIISLLFLAVALVFIYKPFIEGIQFARAQNTWLSTVAESKSLFYLERGPIKEFYLDKAIKKLGYLLFVFPVAFVLLVLKRIKLPLEFMVIVVTTGVIFGFLMVSQQKYALEFSVPYGIGLALFIVWLYKLLSKRGSLVLLIIFIAGIALSLLPLKQDFKEIYSPMNAYDSTFMWLKNDIGLKNTEINTGHVQNDGVMSPWDIGHHLHLYSEAPTVADNFGINVEPYNGFYDMAKFFLSENEDDAIEILKRYKVTYVVVPYSSIFEQYAVLIDRDPSLYHKYNVVKVEGKKRISAEPQPGFFDTIGLRLGDLYGSSNPYQQDQAFELKALKHFRLVYESPKGESAGQEVPAGSLKIYKYVEGTRLKVDVPGNPPYKLEALIRTNTGNMFYYRQKGFLNEGIIAPYPTRPFKDYPSAEYYRVFINGTTYDFNNVE